MYVAFLQLRLFQVQSFYIFFFCAVFSAFANKLAAVRHKYFSIFNYMHSSFDWEEPTSLLTPQSRDSQAIFYQNISLIPHLFIGTMS